MHARECENSAAGRRWPTNTLSREAITAKVVGVCLLLLLAASPDAGCGSTASKVCTPGQSVACVGVAACQGGQLCKADGTAYEACQCGGGAGSGGSSAGRGGGGGDSGGASGVGGSGGSSGQGGSSGVSGSGGNAAGSTGSAGTSQDAGGIDAVTSDAGTPEAGSDAGGLDAGTCASYSTSTIAAMRTAGVTGCFKLVSVVSIGLTPNTTSPSLFVQDASGGAYSAMMMTCSTTSTTHSCAVASSVAAITDGRSVTVTGAYVKSSTTHVEQFFLDSISDTGAGAMPTVATASLAQIERSSNAYDLAFQHVTATVSGPTALAMYDWTPSEFLYAGAAACPYQKGGFGMIPKSVGDAPGAACTDGTSQPAGQAAPNGAEVLIGTDFYKGFTVSSDCRCAKKYAYVIPTATSTLSGTIDGILVFDGVIGASAGFFYVAPKTNSAAPISGTIAGP